MRRTGRLATAAAFLAALGACASALFTAPAGTTVVGIPNPPFVASNGGVPGSSVISAILTEPAGTPVSNGTVVQFFTDIGRIDPTGKTRDGVARVNFESDSRSGIAHISILSGGPAPVTSASPGTGTGTTTGTNSATVEVTVGNVNVKAVKARAEPSRITAGASSTSVIATVIDANGNPIANVPVYFSVITDPATEFFEGSGQPRFTNTNGEAFDILKTRRQFAGTAQVKASAAGPGIFVDSDPLPIPIL